MPVYSDIVLDHFMNPRNVGEIEDADGIGQVGNPTCGDMMDFYIKVEDDKLSDIKFKTFGCGAAIAVSSKVSEMAQGKTLEEVKSMTRQDVADALGGLPPNKMHCSNLGLDALQAAIDNYRAGGPSVHPPHAPGEGGELDHDHDGECQCPYCDGFFEREIGVCEGCGAQVNFCTHCEEPLAQDAERCEKCGQPVAA